MKILLLGKHGQIGSELKKSLMPLGNLITLGREDLELSQFSALQVYLNTLKPHIIVNAAAYTNVDKAESEVEAAFLINEKMVGLLAEFCKKNNATLVHYSTDYVFDGESSGPYLETDVVNPKNTYGLSKLAGEQAILMSGCQYLIFRTNWVHSINKDNFIKMIFQAAQKKDELTVVADQKGSPTSAHLIANVTAIAIKALQQHILETGIYHLTAAGMTTRYDLARYIVDYILRQEMPLQLRLSNIIPTSSAVFSWQAKRPKNSLLNTNKLITALNLSLPDWKQGVNNTLDTLITERNSAKCNLI